MEQFLLRYYNDLANSYDYEIPAKIQEYRNILNNEYENCVLILDGSQAAYDLVEEIYTEIDRSELKQVEVGFKNCLVKTGGKKISRGISWGAITGGITGGIAGAAGSTIVLPGVGTATGAAGGAALGAAKGSIWGAIGGLLWASADCLGSISKQDAYIMRIEEFTTTNALEMDANIFNLDNETVINFTLTD